MSGGIFLIQENKTLVEMNESGYVTENDLQELLANYPNLLAGNQINSVEPRRWLLISREMGIPREEAGANWWSIDHLFLDQDAIPTLVEVKRNSDTRIRREVVGQMLDYAANAIVYWPVERMRATFEADCEARGVDASQSVSQFLESGSDPEQFWQTAQTNLQAGKIRMVFVADAIPPELQRIVEFLNVQMNPAEVLAIEIKQYIGKGLKTLVPRVIGQKAIKVATSPSVRPSKQWDEVTFFQELTTKRGAADAGVARKILDHNRSKNVRVWWGKGAFDGSFVLVLDENSTIYQFLSCWTYGRLEVGFQYLASKPPFDSEEKRNELARRLNTIPGVSVSNSSLTKRPSIPLSILSNETALQQFLDTFDWVIEEIKAT